MLKKIFVSTLNKQNFALQQQQIVALTASSQFNFGKWSKPKKNPKIKEKRSAMAISDEKLGKIADATKTEALKDPYEGLPHIKTYDMIYETKKSQSELDKLEEDQIYKIEGKRVNLSKKRQDGELSQEMQQDLVPISQETMYTNPNEFQRREVSGYNNKVEKQYQNVEDLVNQEFYKEMQYVNIPQSHSKRCGVLATKVGMTMTWDKWGVCIPLTVLQIDRCQVTQVKTEDKEGYYGLQIGYGEPNLKNLKKPEIGHFLKNQIPPKVHLKEFRVTKENLLPVGFMLSPRHFTPGQFVDLSSTSKGKGFQGGMKRWNFSGQNATHGNSINHRTGGSTGQCQDPGKVFKGKKMPGNMGNERVTIQNLKVYKIDVSRSLVYIKGGVPGNNGTVVEIKDSIKNWKENRPYLNYPTFIPEEGKQYADQPIMIPSILDPLEEGFHDNDVID